jgi:hypothetical protein
MKRISTLVRTFGLVSCFGIAALALPRSAHAGGIHVSFGFGLPVPVVVAPQPVYMPPAPVVVAPPPVVYTTPGVVYEQPYAEGYYRYARHPYRYGYDGYRPGYARHPHFHHGWRRW